jgi:hypothetical protein
MRPLTRILFSLPHSGLGAHSAPASREEKERHGALGPPRATESGSAAEPGRSPGLVTCWRLKPEVVTLTFASWNQIGKWLRRVDAIRQAA